VGPSAGLGAGLWVVAWACACDPVPTLAFESAEASLDAANDVSESGGDGGTSDGAGCPGPTPPSDPYVCCGAVVCEGQCTGECDACVGKCTTPGEVCCGKTNNVTCMAAGSVCH
jgi:hypothetical protein